MMGYGLTFYLDDDDEMICYQKEGINAGVSGIMRYFPARDINVVILSNLQDGVWKPIWTVHDLVVDGAFDA